VVVVAAFPNLETRAIALSLRRTMPIVSFPEFRDAARLRIPSIITAVRHFASICWLEPQFDANYDVA